MSRGQGYNNASVATSGIHAGVQRRIKGLNPKALFVPCGSLSLNLMRSDLPSLVIDFLLLWKEFILSFLPQLTGIGCPCKARTHYPLH